MVNQCFSYRKRSLWCNERFSNVMNCRYRSVESSIDYICWSWVLCPLACTRCGPYFGTTVEAVQCLTSQTEMKRSNVQKRDKHTLVLGCKNTLLFWGVRERRFLHVVAELQTKSQKPGKNFFVLQFCSWNGSFRHGEMKIWLCLYFQHVTGIHWDWFCGRKQTKNAKIRKGAFFSRRVLW